MLSFIFSTLLEFSVFHTFLKKYLLKESNLNLFSIIVALNLLTQPIFLFILPLFELSFIPYLVISELFIFIIEGYLIVKVYKKIPIEKGIIISAIANLISWQFTPFFVYLVI